MELREVGLNVIAVVYSNHVLIFKKKGPSSAQVERQFEERGFLQSLFADLAFVKEIASNSESNPGTDESQCAFHAVTMMHEREIGSFFICKVDVFGITQDFRVTWIKVILLGNSESLQSRTNLIFVIVVYQESHYVAVWVVNIQDVIVIDIELAQTRSELSCRYSV